MSLRLPFAVDGNAPLCQRRAVRGLTHRLFRHSRRPAPPVRRNHCGSSGAEIRPIGGGRRVCHGAPATSAPVDHASRASGGPTARLP